MIEAVSNRDIFFIKAVFSPDKNTQRHFSLNFTSHDPIWLGLKDPCCSLCRQKMWYIFTILTLIQEFVRVVYLSSVMASTVYTLFIEQQSITENILSLIFFFCFYFFSKSMLNNMPEKLICSKIFIKLFKYLLKNCEKKILVGYF